MPSILKLSPQNLWRQFAAICQIPHPSKHEEQILSYIKNLLDIHNVAYTQDATGNIIVRKNATAGFEHLQTVTLQAHVDMVPQKNSDSNHDFLKDPIETIIDGDWLKAKQTTLGADNGIGLAAILAVFTSDNLEHGPIEALLTVDEEAGMTGAQNLKPGSLQGDILLNLDSEDENELTIGCAGGINTEVRLPFNREKLPTGFKPFKVNLTGLLGGHSGVDIHLGRGNANTIMNRLLVKLSQAFSCRLISIDGGSLRNAIARESFAVVALPEKKELEIASLINHFTKEIMAELSENGKKLKITIEENKTSEPCMDWNVQEKFLQAIAVCPDAVLGMNPDMPQIVDLSSNLAIVKSYDSAIHITTLQRGARESLKQHAAERIRFTFELAGAEVSHSGSYPGWTPEPDAEIVRIMKETFHMINSKDPHISVIHAGLECGLIKAGHQHMQMISFGPTIRFPHSPFERVHIQSVERFWNYLLKILKKIPAK